MGVYSEGRGNSAIHIFSVFSAKFFENPKDGNTDGHPLIFDKFPKSPGKNDLIHFNCCFPIATMRSSSFLLSAALLIVSTVDVLGVSSR